MAALSLQIGYPTLASVPHSIVNGFKVYIFGRQCSLCINVCACVHVYVHTYIPHLMKTLLPQNLLAVAVATDITFKEAEQVSCYHFTLFQVIFISLLPVIKWPEPSVLSEASGLLRTAHPLPTMRLYPLLHRIRIIRLFF